SHPLLWKPARGRLAPWSAPGQVRMSALAESTLIAHLSDRDSMAAIAAEYIPIEAIPTEALRPVYAFALEYFHGCGRTMAPSPGVLDERFHSLVVEHQLVF